MTTTNKVVFKVNLNDCHLLLNVSHSEPYIAELISYILLHAFIRVEMTHLTRLDLPIAVTTHRVKRSRVITVCFGLIGDHLPMLPRGF